jgi:hypothetical protein
MGEQGAPNSQQSAFGLTFVSFTHDCGDFSGDQRYRVTTSQHPRLCCGSRRRLVKMLTS